MSQLIEMQSSAIKTQFNVSCFSYHTAINKTNIIPWTHKRHSIARPGMWEFWRNRPYHNGTAVYPRSINFSLLKMLVMLHCPACRTTLVATRFRVAVICPIIQVPHCIRVFFYFVWFVFINHIFQFYYELCTYCNILDIYYHKIWILSIMFCFIWSYWIIYFLACLEVSWRVVS